MCVVGLWIRLFHMNLAIIVHVEIGVDIYKMQKTINTSLLPYIRDLSDQT